MGLFKGESLPRSARQIDRAGVNKQNNNNIMGEDIDKRNTQSISSLKKRRCLAVEVDGGHIEYKLK